MEGFSQQKLDQLEAKIRKLVDAHKLLNSKLKACYTENYNLKMILDKKNEDLLHFKNQDKITKIVSSIATGEKSTTELKLKLNEYIKEIEKCISYLSEEL
jgi:thiamine pyrophosphokinase